MSDPDKYCKTKYIPVLLSCNDYQKPKDNDWDQFWTNMGEGFGSLASAYCKCCDGSLDDDTKSQLDGFVEEDFIISSCD